MFSASKLTPEQVDSLKQLAADGASMPDLQKHLKDKHEILITYMDTRFLILDLGIELIEEKEEEPKPEDTPEVIEAAATPVGTSSVSVTMDSVTLPGAMVSGRVVFSDGEKAIWMIDQTGRPSLDPETPSYRPSEEDILEFQTQLRDIIQKQSGGM